MDFKEDHDASLKWLGVFRTSVNIYINRFMFEPEMIRFLMVVIIGGGG